MNVSRSAATMGLALACGCASSPAARTAAPHARAEQFQIGGLDVVTKSAETQMIVFQTPDDVEKLCMAPTPDAVPTRSRQLSLGVGGETLGGGAESGADALGGRGPASLVVREVLYRTCEFALNYRLDKDEALALYRETLDRLERMLPSLVPADKDDTVETTQKTQTVTDDDGN